MKRIGFVGGGRVTRILAGGWQHAGLEIAELLVHEPDEEAFGALRRRVPACQRVTLGAAAAADVVLVAVHPPAFPSTLPGMPGAPAANPLASLMPAGSALSSLLPAATSATTPALPVLPAATGGPAPSLPMGPIFQVSALP